MSGLIRSLYSPRAFDVLFGVVGIGGMLALGYESGLGAPAIAPADVPLHKGGMIIASMVVGVLLACGSIRIDQRVADDFTFQVLARSSLIGMLGFVLAAAAWELLFAASLGALAARTMVVLAVTVWSLSYFYIRLRGTVA